MDTYTRQPATRSATPARRVAKAAGLALAALLVLGGAWAGVGFATLARAEQHHSFALDGPRLVVDIDFGPVTVVGGATGRVEVDAHVHASQLSPAHPSARMDGDRLVLRGGCRELLSIYCMVTYDLHVPGTVALQLATADGRVRVSGLTGALDLRSRDGSITADGAVGPLRLHTEDASIHARGLHSGTVDAHTSNDGITLSFAAAPQQVSALTSDGHISITVPDRSGPYRVDARTVDAHQRIDVPTDPRAARSIVAHTGNAPITVDRAAAA